MPADPGDRDDAVLERLPQRLEHGTRELGQLVQQQHAAVGQARLAGPRHGTTADDRRGRGAVMRRAKRRREDDRAPRRQRAGDGVDARHLERLVPRQRRQDARQPAPEHRLARSRRAGEQHVVLSGGGELERAAAALLPAHLGEIGQERLLELVACPAERRTGSSSSPRRYATAWARWCTGTTSMPASAASGADSAAQMRRRQPCAARALGDGDRARDGPHPAVERELADTAVLEQPLGRELVRAGEKRRARSAGRSPIPPCAAPPERG